MQGLTTKEKIQTLFEENIGEFLSGEYIAEALSVSRNAVWKAVKSLRNDGYNIEAVSNKGYCLSAENDILSEKGLKKYLNPTCSDLRLDIIPILRSTNETAREKALCGEPEGYTVISCGQTNGKGRYGRHFYSPLNTGVYMSILLRPHHYTAQQSIQITTMAAVAACEAIEKVSEKNTQIKWVNDIYIDGRKVSGILTEASVAVENGFLEYAVLGIGINVSPPEGGFPKDIENIAGTVFEKTHSDAKNKIAAEFLNYFMEYYKNPNEHKLIDNYRKRSLVIGQNVEVITHNGRRVAKALGIDDDYRLIVEYENKEKESLFSGEVGVKI